MPGLKACGCVHVIVKRSLFSARHTCIHSAWNWCLGVNPVLNHFCSATEGRGRLGGLAVVPAVSYPYICLRNQNETIAVYNHRAGRREESLSFAAILPSIRKITCTLEETLKWYLYMIFKLLHLIYLWNPESVHFCIYIKACIYSHCTWRFKTATYIYTKFQNDLGLKNISPTDCKIIPTLILHVAHGTEIKFNLLNLGCSFPVVIAV